MTKFFFDTETTSRLDFKLPPEHPSQGRLVQFCGMLVDGGGMVLSQSTVLVRPDEGQVFSPEAVSKHGITYEHAREYGLPIAAALSFFWHAASAADECWAYNVDFDRMVMFGELIHSHKVPRSDWRFFCEMKAMTPVCRLPKTGGYSSRPGDEFKWPSLAEAHRHAFGKDFKGAHDAFNDVKATLAVHQWRVAQPVVAGEEGVLL